MKTSIALAVAASCVLAVATASAQTQRPPPPTCEAALHHALDFWIGEWDAFRSDTNALVGRSSIAASDAGCIINEHWTSVGSPFAYSGRSLNTFDSASGHWEQYWADSTGAHIYFVGGVVEGGAVQMATTGPVAGGPSGPVWRRVTLTPNADGTVTQQGDNSLDGRTWALGYRLTYRHHT